MVKINDRPPSNSTLNIYQSMGDDSLLPDHMLSADSPEKKKRINKQIQEIEFVVFVQKSLVFESLIAWINQKLVEEKINLDREFSLNLELKKLMGDVQVSTNNLTPEQLAKLDDLRHSLENLLGKIDEKISGLTAVVNQHTTELERIDTELARLRTTCGNSWINHFNKSDIKSEFKTITIQLTLPSEFQTSIPEDFKRNLLINPDVFINLGKEIGEKIKIANIDESEIPKVTKEKAEAAIRLELHHKAQSFPEEVRERLIEHWMKQDTVIEAINTLSDATLKTALTDSAVKTDMKEVEKFKFYKINTLEELIQAKEKLNVYAEAKILLNNSINDVANASDGRLKKGDSKDTKNIDNLITSINSISTKISNISMKETNEVSKQCEAVVEKIDKSAATATTQLSQGNLVGFDFNAFLKQTQATTEQAIQLTSNNIPSGKAHNISESASTPKPKL